MRLTSDLWVSALLRRASLAGAFVAVSRKGAKEAGAIYIVRRGRDWMCDLYGPALQMDYSADMSERRFSLLKEKIPEAEINDRMERELRLDSDFWLVEVDSSREQLEDWIETTTPS